MEFPGNFYGMGPGFCFDLEISKGLILQNFKGWKLVFPGISKAKGKMTNLKIPRERGSEHYILNPLHLFDKWQKRF